MPGAWLSLTGDPDAWRSIELAEGDYVEFVPYDSTHVKQGTVLARFDKVSRRVRTGQWTEVTFLAASDEHLDSGAGKDDHRQFELHFCSGAQRQCRESKRGRARDFHTDKFRTVLLGELADKKIEWISRSPHHKFVKEEIARLSGDHHGESHPDAGPSRPNSSFADAGPDLGPAGTGDDVLANLSALEKELGEGPTGRKRKAEAGRAAKAETPVGDTPKKEKRKKKKRVLTRDKAQVVATRRGLEKGKTLRRTRPRARRLAIPPRRRSGTRPRRRRKRRRRRSSERSAKQTVHPLESEPRSRMAAVSIEQLVTRRVGFSRCPFLAGRHEPSASTEGVLPKKPGRLAARLLQRMKASRLGSQGGRGVVTTHEPSIDQNSSAIEQLGLDDPGPHSPRADDGQADARDQNPRPRA